MASFVHEKQVSQQLTHGACKLCGKPAEFVCVYCPLSGLNEQYCFRHKKEHKDFHRSLGAKAPKFVLYVLWDRNI